MSDNANLNNGAGLAVRTDDVGTLATGTPLQMPVSKLALGEKGVDRGLVSDSNPLPVTLADVHQLLLDQNDLLTEIRDALLSLA